MPFLSLSKIRANNGAYNIYCDESGENKIYDLTKLAFPNKLDNIRKCFKYNTNSKFNIENYAIEKVNLEHEDGIESNGCIFSQENVKVGFTGDTGMCEGLHAMAKKCNYLICDCNALKGKNHILELTKL